MLLNFELSFVPQCILSEYIVRHEIKHFLQCETLVDEPDLVLLYQHLTDIKRK